MAPLCPAGCGRPLTLAKSHCPHLSNPDSCPWLKCDCTAVIRRRDLKHIDPSPGLYRD